MHMADKETDFEVDDQDLLQFAELSLSENSPCLPSGMKRNNPVPTRFRTGSKQKVLAEVQNKSDVYPSTVETVDSFFLQNDGKSGLGKTSKNTLSALFGHNQPGLVDPVTLEQSLRQHKPKCSKLSERLQKALGKQLFHKWPFYLNEGFNVLLYGVGSKRSMLEEFRKQFLDSCICVVVPGYEPSMSIRNILNSIYRDCLSILDQVKNPMQQFHTICKLLNSDGAVESPLYILVHNIDGPGLRTAKAQAILAQLASLPHCHMLASMDHANLPVLWSHNELARFSWIWEDCTNMSDYSIEASYSNSPLLQNILGGLSGHGSLSCGAVSTQLASLRQVAASLTQNVREIYRMIAEHQLNAPLNETRGTWVGMPLEDLYWRCRDGFLTNNESTLRAQLTEFRDHKLLKIKKGMDGTELLIIPMNNASLRKFVDNFDTFC